jgi:uncharacterized protein (TIGR02996 family)
MERYELVEGSSSKFWEVWTDAETLYVRFGKIGTQGQTKLKKLASDSAATAERAKLVAEKTKKGYALVGGGSGAAAPKKTKPNAELEKAILADPDSPDGYIVYGDWLTEQGDPLGELVAIDTALAARNGKDDALTKKREALLKEHEEAWFGDLADLKDAGELEVTWRNGFFRSVIGGGEEYGDGNAVDFYTTLRKLPTARFLESLTFRIFDTDDGEPSYAEAVKAMVKLGVPATLRKLAFDVAGYQTSWTDLGDLSKLYPHLEKLEELCIHVGKMKLGTIRLPSLRHFEVKTGGFSKGNMKSVLGATWPKLETLILFFGDDNYGGDCTVDDVRPLLDGASVPNVTYLGLCNAMFQDDIAQAIVGAKVTKRLKALDLSSGTMGDAGAQALLDGAKELTHLEKLDVSENYLSDEMVEKLRAVFGNRLDAIDQGDQNEDPEDRYVQVAE